MNKLGKIIIFFLVIVLIIGTILLKQDIGIKENVYVVSKSENENIDKPENINKEENEDKNQIEKIDQNKVSKNNKKMIPNLRQLLVNLCHCLSAMAMCNGHLNITGSLLNVLNHF